MTTRYALVWRGVRPRLTHNSQNRYSLTGQELALVNNQASIITINTLINHRMTSLQKNVYRTLVTH